MSAVSGELCIPVSPVRSGLKDFLGLPLLNLGQHYSTISNKPNDEADNGHKKVPGIKMQVGAATEIRKAGAQLLS